MKKRLIFIIFLAFFCQDGWGGGVAQRRNVRVNRQVTVNPQQIQRTLPTQTQTDKEEEKEEDVSSKIRPKKVYSPSHVLVSSPDMLGKIQEKKTVSMTENISPQLKDDLLRLIDQLDESSIVWAQIKDVRIQMLIISRYIEIYGQKGVQIKKAPLSYVKMINSLARNDPKLLSYPFAYVLRTVAIMEYDFDNGQDKDILAEKLFGPDFYRQNRKRLGRE